MREERIKEAELREAKINEVKGKYRESENHQNPTSKWFLISLGIVFLAAICYTGSDEYIEKPQMMSI